MYVAFSKSQKSISHSIGKITVLVSRKMQCLRSTSLFGTLPSYRWLLFARGSCSKLFVGGLSYDTNEIVLKEAFGQYGEIIEVKVICHHKSGKSKGYGFVHFTAESAASIALQKMDGQLLDDRNIRVHFAHKGR